MYSLMNKGNVIAVSTFQLLPSHQIPYDHDSHKEFTKDFDMIIELDGGCDIINTKTDYHIYVSYLLASECDRIENTNISLFYTPIEPGDDHFDNCVRVEVIDMDGFCYVMETRMSDELPYSLFYLHHNYSVNLDIIKLRKVDCQIDCSRDVQLSNLYHSYDVLFHNQQLFDFYTKEYFDEPVNELMVR